MNEFEDYQAQLNSTEWNLKRNKILSRDNHKCQICGRVESKRALINGKWWNYGIDYNSLPYGIIPISFSVADFKNLIYAKTIYILRYGESDKFVAISDNGVISDVIVNTEANFQSSDNFQINLIKHHSGLMSFAMIDKDIPSDCVNMRYAAYLSEIPVILNVHHKHYIIQRKAWEYPDEDLVTLCRECHLKVHQAIGVKVYSDENGYMKRIHLTPCLRCSGTGYFPEYKSLFKF